MISGKKQFKIKKVIIELNAMKWWCLLLCRSFLFQLKAFSNHLIEALPATANLYT